MERRAGREGERGIPESGKKERKGELKDHLRQRAVVGEKRVLCATLAGVVTVGERAVGAQGGGKEERSARSGLQHPPVALNATLYCSPITPVPFKLIPTGLRRVVGEKDASTDESWREDGHRGGKCGRS